jgi:putative transposon-encoded protein
MFWTPTVTTMKGIKTGIRDGVLKNEFTTESFKVYAEADVIVKRGGNSGRIYVPKKWLGRRARVLLIEPLGKE